MGFIITLPIEVKSWQFDGKRVTTRDRSGKPLKKPRFFKADRAKEYEAAIDALLMPYRIPVPLDGPLQIHLVYVFRRPRRLCRKKDPDGLIWAPEEADWDNASKTLCDRLTRLGFWKDDRRIVDSRVQKFYAEKATPDAARIHIAAQILPANH